MQLYDVYPLFDIDIVRGKGCHVWDATGQEYLDLYGGHAVISIGHCHPTYTEAMCEQVQKLGFYSNAVGNPLQRELAERLGEMSGYEDYALFLVNSGAEANENALKLASFHTGKRRVLAAQKAFHGRTSLAVEATDNPRIRAVVNQNDNVTFLPLNDLQAYEAELAKGDVAAVIVECIQGVGGVRLADAEFMQGLQAICREHGALLVCDEIQCGYGRSGHFFAHQALGVQPDLITMAKGMGNGFPIGGVLIAPHIQPWHGQLGTTFGGNHLACAAALAVLDVIKSEQLIDNAARVGEYLLNQLQHIKGATEVRGRGLMIGVEFAEPIQKMRTHLVREEHTFTGAASTNILRLLPPLCLTTAEADDFLARLNRTLQTLS